MIHMLQSISIPPLMALVFGPLLAVFLLFVSRTDRWARWWALLSSLAFLWLSVEVWLAFDPAAVGFQFQESRAWIPWLGIGYAIGVDGISLPLVLLTTFVTPLCVLCSWTYIKQRVREFMVALLVMEAAMIGVFVALDFVLFFVFWEAMLIPMALMIGVWGGPRRIYAALKFFIYTVVGSVFLLVAILAMGLHAGTFNIPALMQHGFPAAMQIWVFLALFLAFAVKVPMFPFHTWLPAAHVEAPTAGSVILASVLLKMGAYGFLRFSLPLTPDAAVSFAPAIRWLSVIAIVYGGFTALAQTDLKKLVAYSSVAHMGFVTLGIFSLNMAGLQGGMLQIINHGITTGALFIAVGIVYERLHTRELTLMAGLGPRMKAFTALFGVFCLSSMAFPGTNSFVGEFLVLAGGLKISYVLVACAVPGLVLAAAYMLRVLQRIAYGGTANPDHSALTDLNVREWIMLIPLILFVLLLGLHPAPLMTVIDKPLAGILGAVLGTPVGGTP